MSDPHNIDAMHLKAKALKCSEKFEDAVRLYEQVITMGKPNYVLKSLHDLAIIRIMQRDIYLAFYTLDRLDPPPNIAVEGKTPLGLLYEFLNGAIHLQKRKFKEGIEVMESLDLSYFANETIVQQMVNSYLAYGYFSLGQFEKAAQIYATMEPKGWMSDSDKYNHLLTKGVLLGESEEYPQAKECFESAKAMYSIKVEPTFYLVILDLMSFISEHKTNFTVLVADDSNPKQAELIKKTKQQVWKAIHTLESVNQVNDSNSNLHFYIGVLKTIVGEPGEAVQCFVTAVEKSDDNYFNHFYWKGVALASAGYYDLALGEFETARGIDRGSFKTSLHIGVCHLLLGDLDSAYEAFKAVVGDPQHELEVNFCIGKFFMSRGFMAHAIQSFQFALRSFSQEKVLQELVKCYIAEKNLVAAMETYTQLEAVQSRIKKQYSFDSSVLSSLKLSADGNWTQSLAVLNDLEVSRKEGFIFRRFDLLVYIGVSQFLAGEYQNSLKTWMLLEMEFYTRDDQALPPEAEMDSFAMMFVSLTEREGQRFIPTKSITLPEVMHNMGLCLLKLGHFDKAYLKLASLRRIPEVKLKVDRLLTYMSRFVSQESIEKVERNLEFLGAVGLDSGKGGASLVPQLGTSLEADPAGKPTDLSILPCENRLCSIYPHTEVSYPSGATATLNLSFCLPSIELSDIKIKAGFEELLKLNLHSVEYRAEAPWVKKVKQTLLFTSEMVSEEAQEYSSPEEFIQRLQVNGVMPSSTQVKLLPNTLVRLNIKKGYESHIKAVQARIEKKKREAEDRIQHEQARMAQEDVSSRGDLDDEDLFLRKPDMSMQNLEHRVLREHLALQRGMDEDDSELEFQQASSGKEGTPSIKRDLKKLKEQLQLDDRTHQILSKISKK